MALFQMAIHSLGGRSLQSVSKPLTRVVRFTTKEWRIQVTRATRRYGVRSSVNEEPLEPWRIQERVAFMCRARG